MAFLNPFRWFSRPLLVDLLTYAGVRWALWRYEWKQCIALLLGHTIGLIAFGLCICFALLFSGWACVLALTPCIGHKAWALLITAGLYLIVGWGAWRILIRIARVGKLQGMLAIDTRRRSKTKKRKGNARLT